VSQNASRTIFGIHAAALEVRSRRMGVIASNIANAATPGFKARDVDFAAALEAKLAAGGAGRAGAGSGIGPARMMREPDLLYRTPTMPSLDGNTVELAREQLAFAENATRYSATLSFVKGKVSTLTRALKGE
jgi:flagellar basal-body rod protein FlgB